MSQWNGREKNVFSVPVDQPEVCVIYFYFNRFGRRKSLFISFFVASLGAIGALLMTDKAEHDNGEKYSTITQSWAQTFKEHNFVLVKMPVNENAIREEIKTEKDYCPPPPPHHTPLCSDGKRERRTLSGVSIICSGRKGAVEKHFCPKDCIYKGPDGVSRKAVSRNTAKQFSR